MSILFVVFISLLTMRCRSTEFCHAFRENGHRLNMAFPVSPDDNDWYLIVAIGEQFWQIFSNFSVSDDSQYFGYNSSNYRMGFVANYWNHTEDDEVTEKYNLALLKVVLKHFRMISGLGLE